MPVPTPAANTSPNLGLFRTRTLHLLMALAGLLTPALPLSAAETAPPLMLATVYHAGVSLPDYWVSEKYDGVRGYWDGDKLLTRGGERIAAPAWFAAGACVGAEVQPVRTRLRPALLDLLERLLDHARDHHRVGGAGERGGFRIAAVADVGQVAAQVAPHGPSHEPREVEPD